MTEPASTVSPPVSAPPVGAPVQAAVPAAVPPVPGALEVKILPSPWPLRDNLRRVAWMFVRALLFRPSFHNWYAWRRFLLRLMGAEIGSGVRVRPTARIEMPWHLQIGADTVVGDEAILYSLGNIRIGRKVIISQYAHLCAGTHDLTDPAFPLLTPPVVVEDGAWVAADAFVGPGVTVGAWAVVGARSTVVKDIPPGQIWAGNPARFIKPRDLKR